MVALEDSDFAVLGDSIDLSQVSAVPVGSTVGYVKQATLIMIQHLNKFSLAADERLRQISSSISRLETELTILESKLASIPGLESIKPTVVTLEVPGESAGTTLPFGLPPGQASQKQNQPPPPSPPQPIQPNASVATTPAPIPPSSPAVVATEAPIPTPSPTVMTVKMDPVYSNYFRMIVLGAPIQAIKMNMKAEGLNPDLLDTPNAPSPSGSFPAQRVIKDDTDGSSSDDSD